MVQVGRPVDLPGVVAVSDDVGQFVLVGEFTGDRLEDVDGRDQAFDGAELVGHQHQLAARTLERVHQAQDADGLVHDDGVTQAVAAHPAFSNQVGHQALGAGNAQHLVQRSPADREEAVRGLGQLAADQFGIIVDVDPGHVRARRHDRADGTFSQGQHPAHHVAFFDAEGRHGRAVRVGQVGLVAGGRAFAQHAQHGRGRAFAHGAAGVQLQQVAARHLVERFDGHRETDGGIQVPLGHLETEGFSQQRKADHQEEAQAQDHHGRVRIDEARQGLGGQQHDADGDDDGDHHDGQVIHHAHGGDHGVQREHRIQHHDLRDDDPEARVHARPGRAGVLPALQALVELHRALEQQEEATHHQDQVASRGGQRTDGKQRGGQGSTP
ncbi:hypothetical protein G6F57_015709 [Rhizopus arrhizus]|nr:hypothetical protein G6F57_015709 [Rhizopus arrhizus]